MRALPSGLPSSWDGSRGKTQPRERPAWRAPPPRPGPADPQSRTGWSSCGNASEDIDVTSIVRAWDEDRIVNNGLALRTSDTNERAYKAFCSKYVNLSGTSCNTISRVPTLIVTYDAHMEVPSSLSPTSAMVGALMPELSGTITGAPDVSFVGEFEVLDAVSNQPVTNEAYLLGSATVGPGVSSVKIDEDALQRQARCTSGGCAARTGPRRRPGPLISCSHRSDRDRGHDSQRRVRRHDGVPGRFGARAGEPPTPSLSARVRDVDFLGGAESTRP